MKNFQIFPVVLFFAACAFFTSCKPEAIEEPIVKDTFPTVPQASRIIIHFGTSTQNGCLYSFSNCIWIGWGTEVTNFDNRFALRFNNPDAASQYFGNYYPLTADYVVTADEAAKLGIEPQTLPSGFYPLAFTPAGAMVPFDVQNYSPLPQLVNENNPQDNIGQLHNLAMQVILSPENRDHIASLGDDQKAIESFVLDQTFTYLEEAGVPVSQTEQQKVRALGFDMDYSNYTARLEETRMTDNDKNVLRGIMDEVSGFDIGNVKDLGKFVTRLTEIENNLVHNTQLDDPAMVLSTVSTIKYSRYYWYWRSISKGNGGTVEPSQIPDWVWADIIGFELGGPAGSIAASVIVYLDTH
ncbi:MAG: hypothetical protein IT270_09685 [Saprospiraceae bacterium]|nr:hypothetical protein [Saprospiraceae bacterium]